MSESENKRVSQALRELAKEINDLQKDVVILQQESKNLRVELNSEIENSCNMYTALIEGRDIHIVDVPGETVMFKIQPKPIELKTKPKSKPKAESKCDWAK